MLGLHAPGHHGEAHPLGQRGDAADQSAGVVVALHVADEGAIDLHRVHTMLTQVRQSGVAAAEVVDREPQRRARAAERGWC